MFTGIVEELGTVLTAGPVRVEIGCRTVAADAQVGASIAVNGVCLTVVERADACLAFDVTEETRRRSALGRVAAGDPVNLERPVTLLQRLGGHLVQGHVDGVGLVEDVRGEGPETVMRVRAPGDLSPYLVPKGSVAVDGVSLTVAAVSGAVFDVALIPHTLAVTTLGRVGPGDPVNLEVDVIAKYVESLMSRREVELP